MADFSAEIAPQIAPQIATEVVSVVLWAAAMPAAGWAGRSATALAGVAQEIIAVAPAAALTDLAAGMTGCPPTETGTLWEALGRAMAQARGPLVICLQADAVPVPVPVPVPGSGPGPGPGWAAALLAPFADPAVGCVGGDILTGGGNREGGPAGAPAGGPAGAPDGKPGDEPDDRSLQRAALSGWQGASYADLRHAAFRKTALVAAGPLDASLGWAGPVDLGKRLVAATAFRLVHAPGAAVRLPVPASVSDVWNQEQAATTDIGLWRSRNGDRIGVLSAPFKTAALAALQDIAATGPAARPHVWPLASALGRATGLLEVVDADGTGTAPRKTCMICGTTRFGPGPGGRMAGTQAPECTGCGALERHRVIDGVLKAIPADRRARLDLLTIGESLRKTQRLFRDQRHMPLTQALGPQAQTAPAMADVVLGISVLSAAPATDLVRVVEALITPLRDDGILIVAERLAGAATATMARGNGGFVIGGDLGVALAQVLPEVHIASAVLADDVTGEPQIIVVAGMDHRAITTLLSVAQQTMLARLFA